MLAIVEPARWDAVRGGLRALGPAGRGHRPGHRRRRHRRVRRRRRPREIARIPAAALTSDAIVHERVGRAARRAAAPRRRPGARTTAARRAAGARHGPGRRPAGAPRHRRTSPSRRAVFEQYDSTVQANTVAGPGPRRRGRPHQGHDEGARRLDRREPGGRRARPVAGRGAERRRGDPQRRDHRRPAARRHELPELRRPDPARGVLAAERGASAASATRAGRSACRSPAATSRSTTSRRPGAIAPTPEIGVVGLLEDVALARRAGVRARPATASCSSARRRRASRAATTPALAGVAAEDGPPALDLAPRARSSRRSSARRRRAACSRRPRTCRAAGSRSRSPSAAIWADDDRGLGATLRLPVASSPAVDLFGESPSRLVVSCRPRHAPALDLLARQHGLPIEELGDGRRRAARRRARTAPARPAPPRSAAAASPTRSTSALDDLRHAWERGLPRALGWEDGR